MYIGIDGCPGGWLAIVLDAAGNWRVDMAERLSVLLSAEVSLTSCLIDMPIGLPGATDTAGSGVRTCDSLARKQLGRRHASVFSPPVREVLDCSAYARANDKSRRLTGRGISRQAWNLRHKIRELDGFLRQRPGLVRTIRECHPELVFSELLGRPLLDSKKTESGFALRAELLQSVYPETAAVLACCARRYRQRQVRRDDVLDALGLAVLAWRGRGHYEALPHEPEYDSKGLPMQIVCGLARKEELS